MRLPLRLGLWAGLAGLVALAVLAFIYGGIARRFDLDALGTMPERSEVVDRNGIVLGRLHGENRTVVELAEVSPHFVQAILAREDNRFHNHPGVDPVGVARAAARNLKERDVVQGASTITMQLARNSYGIFERSLHRKLTEMALAFRIEHAYTKDEILEAYVNRIFFGTGIYGIERAAQSYFGKPARDLTLGESAMLAGIVRGPNRFSPFRNLEGALVERDTVLDRMVDTGRITVEQAAAAKAAPVRVVERAGDSREASYALDAVRRDLDIILDDKDVEDGGFRIFTTIDIRIQSAAEQFVERRLSDVEGSEGYRHQTRAGFLAGGAVVGETRPDYLQGALIALDNTTGGMLCIVGGRNFQESQFNRALLSKRQVGSTFKPFVYTAGFQSGIFPGTLISDGPIRPGELRTTRGNWSPENSDGKFLAPQPAAVGLIRSRNTMSVRVGDIAGIDRVIDLARRAGFTDAIEPTPQVYIGNLGATLTTLTSAFSIYPNNGMRRRPFVIDRIEDRNGEVIFRSGVIEYPVIPPGVSSMVEKILGQIVEPGGTAASARQMGLEGPAGGKTGTTNDYHDAWFVGFNERLTCGVWVGLDQPERIMNRGYGSTLALPIWVDLMKFAGKIGYVQDTPRARPLLADLELCRISAKLATGGCRSAGTAYTEQAPYELAPRMFCDAHADRRAPSRGGTLPPGAAPPTAQPSGGRGLFDRIRDWFR